MLKQHGLFYTIFGNNYARKGKRNCKIHTGPFMTGILFPSVSYFFIVTCQLLKTALIFPQFCSKSFSLSFKTLSNFSSEYISYNLCLETLIFKVIFDKVLSYIYFLVVIINTLIGILYYCLLNDIQIWNHFSSFLDMELNRILKVICQVSLSKDISSSMFHLISIL